LDFSESIIFHNPEKSVGKVKKRRSIGVEECDHKNFSKLFMLSRLDIFMKEK